MTDSDCLLCRVEIPKGSRNKYEWDPDLKAIKLDRLLSSSVAYPTDYGFIPETLGADGDHLDALVCITEPTFPGCVIPVKPIALFRMRDEAGEDDKILCVPLNDPNWNTLVTLDDLPDTLRTEIAHFFAIYKQPEGKKVEIEGWQSVDCALERIDTARKAFAGALSADGRTADSPSATSGSLVVWGDEHSQTRRGVRPSAGSPAVAAG